jgi:choline transport protein
MRSLTLIFDFSRAPLSGGQYNWVSEFAPPGSQALLSYLTGWICVLGWHTGIAGCSYTVANMMVGAIAINYPDTYTYERWHVTLLVIAVAIVALMFNTFLAQKLPLIEGIILIVHCFGFFGILIPLWVLSPKVPASEVFGSIENRGGWDNNGLACMAGLVGPIYALIGMSPRWLILFCPLLTISPEKAPTQRFIWVCTLLFPSPWGKRLRK